MKDKSLPARNVARRARRANVFGPEAVCQWCGYANPVALVAVKKTLLEEHHVFGAAFDDGTRIALCRNCHAELTEGTQATGATMRPQRSLFEILIQVNHALEVFHRSASLAHGRWARGLETRVNALDEGFSDWRSIEDGL